MNMNAPRRVESVHLGTPPTGYQEWTTTKVHVNGFADLSAERDVPVASPEFMALGNPWYLKLYPGGIPPKKIIANKNHFN